MEEALAKIRIHTSSTLAHQKAPASLLHALEDTFRDQHTEQSPTAYFAALLTTLDGTLQNKNLGIEEADILPAELYLLALVAPFISPPVIRSNLNTIISLTAPLFPLLLTQAPPLRSQLSLYEAVILSLEHTQLEVQGIRQSFASILQLSLDPRPKVRKRAADLVTHVLSSPPPPLLRHPYSERVAEWLKGALTEYTTVVIPQAKSKSSEVPNAETGIHILAFLRPNLLSLPPSSLPSITNLLLALPRLGNSYLTQSAYSILSILFSAATSQDESAIIAQIPDVLKAILSSVPVASEKTFSPAWLQLIGNAMLAYSTADSAACAVEFGKVWKAVWPFLESPDVSTRQAAATALEMLLQSLTPALIESSVVEALAGESRSSTLGKIVSEVTKALDSLAFARSIPELLSVISCLITSLRYRGTSRASPTAAESLLLPLIQKIGGLRVQKGFEYKEMADATLSTAMRVVGPEVLLRVLPLNLEPADRESALEARAFLLPLLSHPHPSPLGHFASYFVPLSERMFNLQQKADMEGRAAEAKVWSVLIAQVWAGLAGYCYGTVDLREALNPTFSQLLSQVLYGQPELRPAILKALKVMVDSNIALSTPEEAPRNNKQLIMFDLSPEEAKLNVEYLRTQAESWLAVFFNVFGSITRDERGMVGDVISAWASIALEKDIAQAYQKVLHLFTQSLTTIPTPSSKDPTTAGENLTLTAEDLLILLLPYLSAVDATALFQTCLSGEVLRAKDNGVQKRGYKILAKLVESGKVVVECEGTLRELDELGDNLAPAAKKDRFTLFALLVPLIPATSLHLIPSLIPEAVLGTKEPSEKARTAAFEFIVAMGHKMAEGGVVRRSLVDGMDEDGDGDGAGEATASVKEYMTMVAGGLAGASPHMISATVTAISRLVFEFKDVISPQMHTEIFSTLLVFLTSANREIVKSILGFIKLAIHTLPIAIIQPHLKDLVPALLGWSHDHKNHFKAKVRHIFERMLRRFGWEEVYSCAGEEEAAKVLVNIKKRKERAKRKKARAGEEEADEAPSGKAATGDAFEDVLYGSESEIDDSEDDGPAEGQKTKSKRKGAELGARLRVDDDEPMDLLEGVASRIANNPSNRRRKPGQDATHFKTDESGKLLLDSDNDSDDGEGKNAGGPTVDIKGTAYREGLTSVDGFTRGANGRVKFNKDTKKRRRENADMDVEMGDAESTAKPKKSPRKAEQKLGHEFKAKKAGGDIKKGAVDPYAYMSLSQAAKKGGRGRGGHIGIAGKR